MPRRARPLSVFMGLPQVTREVLRSQPAVADDPDSGNEREHEHEHEPSPANLLPTQPRRASEPPAETSESKAVPGHADSTPSSSSGLASALVSHKRPASPDSTPRCRKVAKVNGGPEDSPHAWDCTGLVPRYTEAQDVPPHLKKYFYQRHSLFPAYSRLPLLLDETGWYSVTPAVIAGHIAERCRSDVVLDAFCGVGGNAIAFARTCERVIAMDNDITRLRLARHNALHSGVADRIEFVLADYVEWARDTARAGEREVIDVVFLSPPWGGPEYLAFDKYPLKAVEPIPGDELFRITEAITPNIAYFLPRNMDVEELGRLARPLEAGEGEGKGEGEGEGAEGRDREWVEVEEEWVGDKLKAVTAYFGGLVG